MLYLSWISLVINVVNNVHCSLTFSLHKQGSNIAKLLIPVAIDKQLFVLTTSLNLAAGAAIITHLVDEIKTQGLGEGISLFIFVSMLLSE